MLIQPLHLLSRAVLVVDKENVIRHLQVVPEITELPDLEAAMQAAKGYCRGGFETRSYKSRPLQNGKGDPAPRRGRLSS